MYCGLCSGHVFNISVYVSKFLVVFRNEVPIANECRVLAILVNMRFLSWSMSLFVAFFSLSCPGIGTLLRDFKH